MHRHSLREVLDAPNVMKLIKDTKAAQEVNLESKLPNYNYQHDNITFLFLSLSSLGFMASALSLQSLTHFPFKYAGPSS